MNLKTLSSEGKIAYLIKPILKVLQEAGGQLERSEIKERIADMDDQIAEDFLSKNNFSCMFRAHQPVPNGFRQDFKYPPTNCSESFSSVPHYTVFSSANYGTSDQPASIVRINSNHENFNVIEFGGEKYDPSMRNNIPDYTEISTIEGIEI